MKLLPRAWSDLLDSFDWYENQRADLQELPRLYGLIGLKTREFRLRRYPYIVFYQTEESGVVISGLLHERRDRRIWDDVIREYQPIYVNMAA